MTAAELRFEAELDELSAYESSWDDYDAAYEASMYDEEEEESYIPEDDDGLTDVEADAMTLAGAGWGTEEDYGYYGSSEDYYGEGY